MSEEQARRVQAQFGASAAAYVTSPLHAAGEDLDRLLAWGAARRADRVLDVATGGGHTALAFARIVRRVVACDLTEPMLAAARAHVRARGAANVEFVSGDADALPFRDEAFDVVTCRTAAHHFADVATAVKQMHRVLRPGGSLLLQDILGHDDADANAFILEVEKRRDPSHVRSYRAAHWKAFLRAAGSACSARSSRASSPDIPSSPVTPTRRPSAAAPAPRSFACVLAYAEPAGPSRECQSRSARIRI